MAPLLSEEGVGDIDGVLTWTVSGFQGSESGSSVRVFVEVEGRDLLQGSPDTPIVFNVFGYLVDEAGAVVGHLSQRIPVENRHQVEIIRNGGLRFVGELLAPPGRSSFRVLIRNRQTQRHFLGRCVIDVPTGESDAPLLLPPLVADRTESWVIAFQNSLPLTEGPVSPAGIDHWPSAMPVWRSGEPLDLVIAGPNPDGHHRLSARLVDRLGPALADIDIDLVQKLVTSNGLSFYRASVAAPDVPEGEYRLELVVTDEASSATASQILPVLIHDRAELSVWTDPEAPRARTPRPTASRSEVAEMAATSAAPVADDSPPLLANAVSVEERFVGGDPDAPPPSGPIEALALGGVGGRAAALLLSGQSGGGVAGAVVWTTAGPIAGAEEVSIEVVVEVDGHDLLAGSRVLPIPIEVYGCLTDGKGTVIGHLAEGILVDGRPWAEKIEGTGVKFVGQLRAPPGVYSCRILVRNRQSHQFFLARSDLDLRSDIGTDPFLLPPLIAEPEDGWEVVFQHDLVPEVAKSSFHGTASWPSAMPAWRSEDPLAIVIGGSELGTGRVVSARLVDREGYQVIDPDVEVEASIPTTGDLAFYRATVAAPDIPVGEYRLEVVVTDKNTGRTVTQSLPVLIHDQSGALVWTDSTAPRMAEPLSMRARMSEPTTEEIDQEAMRTAYTEALRLWSVEDAFAAKRALAELERPVEATASDRRWRQLFTIERATALALAKSNPASVLGVALLHRDMGRWYMSRRETQLAQHSWRMAAMIARAVPSIQGWDPPEGFTECMLLDLARHLAQAGQLEQAREVLQITIEEVPTSTAAHLGLGALYERTGSPAQAVEELAKLVDIDPGHHEGRLRLAVNRRRVGADHAAEDLLRGLLSLSSPRWIRTVTYQELSRLLADQGRLEEAERLLRQGLSEIPENQRLRILLAQVLDKARRPREATAEIERLTAIEAERTTSPRYLYSRWPDFDGDRVRSTLIAAEGEGVAALREALR